MPTSNDAYGELKKATEEFFWAHLVTQAFPFADEAKKKVLKRRFSAECKQYVALSLSEELSRLKQETPHSRKSEEFFSDVIEKAQAMRDDIGKEFDRSDGKSSPAPPEARSSAVVALVVVLLLVVIGLGIYWLWIK
jgi:hypothetical protein